ncbi:hypothetical protein ElyMa_000695100 [Elysia marginata]|uniref:Uncharacterized protein n=1 Tax=Elysia marginata TaxID=1093978 RepID=A0AAV4GI59_9GAST|nr:hypothetical protein ElyMa_000695100 [Elysia marginata]
MRRQCHHRKVITFPAGQWSSEGSRDEQAGKAWVFQHPQVNNSDLGETVVTIGVRSIPPPGLAAANGRRSHSDYLEDQGVRELTLRVSM